MTEQEAHALLERAITQCHADDAVLALHGVDEASTRFANSTITQSVARADARLTVRVAFGNRVGIAQTNMFGEDALRETARRAEEIARQSEPDTEYLPPVEPTLIRPVHAFDDNVPALSASRRVRLAIEAIRVVDSHGLSAAGSFTTAINFAAVLNSRGHFAYHRDTSVRLVCTAIGPTSSGWASAGSFRVCEVDPEEVAATAAKKALAAANPREANPKPMTVILEPAAVAELLGFLAWSLDAKAADEGRSALSGELGERIGVPGLQVWSDPHEAECPACPFTDEGMPLPRVLWLEDGCLRNLAHTRYWAQKSGRQFTGMPANLLMSGSEHGVDRLVRTTENGLLVTRFWYIRYVDPMKLLLTGMTRDGLFQIRDGEVVGGVKNMRFNESPLRMLEKIVALGRPERVWSYRPMMVPPMKVEAFTFSSATAF